MIKPVSGYFLMETKSVGGSEFVSSNGDKIGAEKENIVVAVSKKDEVEWKVGDKVAIGENAVGFSLEEKEKKYALMPNSAIIAIL